jgi:carboxypeptidase family protein
LERTSRVGFKGLASRKIRASGSVINIRTSRLISELMIRKNRIRGEFMSEKFSSTLSFYLRGLAVITALFLATLAVYAQSNATDGALDGYVLDESGAIIPGAKIVARNVQTNVELTANADGQGYFRFPLLRVGSYEIVANDRPFFRGHNDVKGPDYFQIDFGLVRRLVFSDRYSIELIAEVENLTNRFNANCSIAGCMGAVVNVATASDFGRGASVRPPRRFQFGGRFTF